jgi:hypothetical protein
MLLFADASSLLRTATSNFNLAIAPGNAVVSCCYQPKSQKARPKRVTARFVMD